LLGFVDILAPEHHDDIVVERLADRRCRVGIDRLPQVDSLDLGAERRAEWHYGHRHDAVSSWILPADSSRHTRRLALALGTVRFSRRTIALRRRSCHLRRDACAQLVPAGTALACRNRLCFRRR
jgi:hypothetical protein